MAPKRKRVAKKPVVQKQKQKQQQNVSQRVTVNLVPAKPKAPRRRAIANSGYKAYQSQPQAPIFLNNPAPVFPTQQNQGFSPVQASQPLGVRVMEPASQFSPPERIEAPTPPAPIAIERNPLRNSTIFGDEEPIITNPQTPVSSRSSDYTDLSSIGFPADLSDISSSGSLSKLFMPFEQEQIRPDQQMQQQPRPDQQMQQQPTERQERTQRAKLEFLARNQEKMAGRPIPPATNKMFVRLSKPALIQMAEGFGLSTTRTGSKGTSVTMSVEDLKASIGQYIKNNQ